MWYKIWEKVVVKKWLRSDCAYGKHHILLTEYQYMKPCYEWSILTIQYIDSRWVYKCKEDWYVWWRCDEMLEPYNKDPIFRFLKEKE